MNSAYLPIFVMNLFILSIRSCILHNRDSVSTSGVSTVMSSFVYIPASADPVSVSAIIASSVSSRLSDVVAISKKYTRLIY